MSHAQNIVKTHKEINPVSLSLNQWVLQSADSMIIMSMIAAGPDDPGSNPLRQLRI
jgi:hypothetical protein